MYEGGGNRNSRGDTTIDSALADPRNGTVRSVGVTNSPIGRLNEHMRMYGGNERKNAWLQELVDAHMLPLMSTLEVLEIEGIWRDREIAWIEAYVASGRRIKHGTTYMFRMWQVAECRLCSWKWIDSVLCKSHMSCDFLCEGCIKKLNAKAAQEGA